MDKTAKKTYEYLLSRPGYYFDHRVGITPAGISREEFLLSLDWLVENHYAEHSFSFPDRIIGTRLTHKGIHKLKIEREERKTAFFTRFIPGLISGIAIGVSANLLAHWLSSIIF